MNGEYWFGKLIDHLVSLGHRRVAYIGANPDLKIQADRLNGYQQSLARHGLVLDPSLVVEGDLTSEGGYRAALTCSPCPSRPAPSPAWTT